MQQQRHRRHRLHLLLLLLLFAPLFVAVLVGATVPVQEYQAQQGIPQPLEQQPPQVTGGKWDHNYSCIFQAGATFTYLHIAYVTYFNISAKPPTFCSLEQCLDSCTGDCSCTAAVYDLSTTACYQYHDYVPVQSIPFIPVHGRDTITAYIKVQHGYYYSAASSPNLRKFFVPFTALLATAAIL